ncbi:MAG: small subunit ribosomal protein [Patescibacteria group bacterium]|nr:small subunit ribosomal protein [Patescibacteria group bacterium]
MSKYIESIGRRKTSTARVRITEADKNSFLINGKEVNEYFPTKEMQTVAREALDKSGLEQGFIVTVVVNGSGIHSQAEAVRHGLARALVERDNEMRKTLKQIGFLKRDPRSKERKKFGLKKARKAPTWSKR